jgi:uncharacterized phage protein (predicted DNA packaging)
MKWLTIDDIKQQLRLDYDCEEGLLELYGSSAEDMLLNYIGMSYEEVIAEYGDVPPALRHATLMLVDSSYTHRSPASIQQMYYVLYGFDALVKPYVKL